MIFLISHAFAISPPLEKATAPGNCLKRPCDQIAADPLAGIVPADMVAAIGQGVRTDLAYTPIEVEIADGVLSGYLIAETTRTGDLDTTGGTWLYAEGLLDNDANLDVVAGEVIYTPGDSFTASLDVMFDIGRSTFASEGTLDISASYTSGGSAAAPVYGWTLRGMTLSDTRGTALYSVSNQPLNLDISCYGFAYHMTQSTRTSTAVTVHEALSVFADGSVFVANALGAVSRTNSTVSSDETWTDGVDVDSSVESVTASSREYSSNATAFALASGVIDQQTTSTYGTATRSDVTTTTMDGGSGPTVRTATGGGATLTVTAFPTAGLYGSPFMSMTRTIGNR